MVQYRFCDRVVPRAECREDRDVAAVIRSVRRDGSVSHEESQGDRFVID